MVCRLIVAPQFCTGQFAFQDLVATFIVWQGSLEANPRVVFGSFGKNYNYDNLCCYIGL